MVNESDDNHYYLDNVYWQCRFVYDNAGKDQDDNANDDYQHDDMKRRAIRRNMIIIIIITRVIDE